MPDKEIRIRVFEKEGGPRSMKSTYLGVIMTFLLMGMEYHAESLKGVEGLDGVRYEPEFSSTKRNISFDELYDPVSSSYGQVSYPPLMVKDPLFTIPWATPYFRCFFKENEPSLKFEVRKAWIAYRFQDFAQVRAHVRERSVVFSGVSPGIDVEYTIERDYVLEEIILTRPQKVYEFVQTMTFEGVTPVEREKGIYFSNGERVLFGIPPPVMYEMGNPQVQCRGLH